MQNANLGPHRYAHCQRGRVEAVRSAILAWSAVRKKDLRCSCDAPSRRTAHVLVYLPSHRPGEHDAGQLNRLDIANVRFLGHQTSQSLGIVAPAAVDQHSRLRGGQ